MMLEIARHPHVQSKLRSEIREKEREIHARGDVEFSANDFDSMLYLNAVIKASRKLIFCRISMLTLRLGGPTIPSHCR